MMYSCTGSISDFTSYIAIPALIGAFNYASYNIKMYRDKEGRVYMNSKDTYEMWQMPRSTYS